MASKGGEKVDESIVYPATYLLNMLKSALNENDNMSDKARAVTSIHLPPQLLQVWQSNSSPQATPTKYKTPRTQFKKAIFQTVYGTITGGQPKNEASSLHSLGLANRIVATLASEMGVTNDTSKDALKELVKKVDDAYIQEMIEKMMASDEFAKKVHMCALKAEVSPLSALPSQYLTKYFELHPEHELILVNHTAYVQTFLSTEQFRDVVVQAAVENNKSPLDDLAQHFREYFFSIHPDMRHELCSKRGRPDANLDGDARPPKKPHL